MLKKLLENSEVENWDAFCPFIQYYINSRISDHVGSSPWSLMFGREPNQLTDHTKTTIDWTIDDPSKMATTLNRRWSDLFQVIFPAIAKRTAIKNQVETERFESHNKITEFKIGDRVMYLDPLYTEQKITNHWGRIYIGPITITEINRNKGRYRGWEDIDESDGQNLTRWLPPSHLKPYAKMEAITEEKKGLHREQLYLVKYFNGEQVWVNTTTVPESLKKTYQQQLLLQRGHQRTQQQQQQKLQQQLAEMQHQHQQLQQQQLDDDETMNIILDE